MRILILGGTNFIGPAVVAELRSAGHDLAVFHRGQAEHMANDPAITHIHADRARIQDHTDDLRAFAPDTVLDMSCMFERDARTAITTLRGIAQRAIVISSVDVYRAYGRMHGSEPGPVEPMPLTEDSPLRERLYPYRGERKDRSFDDYDKIPVEQAYLSEPDLPGIVVRLPAVHGERDSQRRLFMEVRRFDAHRPHIIVQQDAVAWQWPRAYAGNVARAIALAVTHPTPGAIFNAPVDPPLTQLEWLRTCARIAGWRGDIVAVPAALMPEHLRQPVNFAQSILIDDTRIRTQLGYADALTAEEGIRRAIEWERANPPEKISSRYLKYADEDAAVQAVRDARDS